LYREIYLTFCHGRDLSLGRPARQAII
jgi:hypothetical protein